MNFLYEEIKQGIRVNRVFGRDSIVEIPAEIEGKPVTELGAYAFSDKMDSQDLQNALTDGKLCREDGKPCCSKEKETIFPENEPEAAGAQVTEIFLPDKMKKIGRYAFYNCSNLQRIKFHSSLTDIGAGAFTGCHKIRRMSVEVGDDGISCLRELLSELPEEMLVDYHRADVEGRFVFPEFFEEGVENTPARILENHVHGSGMRYRNCFQNKSLNIREYDELFDCARAWEREEVVLELALCRIRYPMELAQKARTQYLNYLKEHPVHMFENLLKKKEYGFLGGLLEEVLPDHETADKMLRIAEKLGDTQGVSLVMDYLHRHTKKQKRKFEF